MEYHDKFAQLSRYAPNDVDDDKDKQHRFLKGLYDGLQLQLMSNTYPNFQSLVNSAIVIDDKRKETEAKKRRLQGQFLVIPHSRWTSGTEARRIQVPQARIHDCGGVSGQVRTTITLCSK